MTARSPEERKLVTVLFADLVGSTAPTVQHDPEQLRALLSAFFEEITSFTPVSSPARPRS